ncbi:hypothetical protein GCM10020001_070430 [Nonomuraea salmonea]
MVVKGYGGHRRGRFVGVEIPELVIEQEEHAFGDERLDPLGAEPSPRPLPHSPHVEPLGGVGEQREYAGKVRGFRSAQGERVQEGGGVHNTNPSMPWVATAARCVMAQWCAEAKWGHIPDVYG